MASAYGAKHKLLQAALASLAINAVGALLPLFAGNAQSNSAFVKVSDAIAAPAGVFAGAFAPHEHTLGAFTSAALALLTVSFLFYALISWLVIEASIYAAGRLQQQRR